MIASLLIGLLACGFKASTSVESSDTGAFIDNTEPDDGASDDTGSTEDSDGDDPLPPEEVDDDRDGYTEQSGDCDDDDADINPGAEDTCDGRDNDCDSAIDEDATPDDYEPNDTLDFPLGDLEDTIELSAFLATEDDVDRYRFNYSDSWIDFDGLTVALLGLDGSVTYKLEIFEVESGEEIFEEFNTVDDESIEFELDSGWGSDSGEFRVVVSSLGGGGCLHEYRLEIVHSDWWT